MRCQRRARREWSNAVIGIALLPTVVVGAMLVWFGSKAATRYRVVNYSMLPTLRPGDRLLVNRLTYRWRQPRRGEIVVFSQPGRGGPETIKRVVGLPREHVRLRHGRVQANGRPIDEPYTTIASVDGETKQWTLGSDEFLVLGDNRRDSRDSRHFGRLERHRLRGLAWYRYWPPRARGRLRIH